MTEINMSKNYNFVKPKEIMQKIQDDDFCSVLGDLVPIYNTSDLMIKIADLSSKDKNVSMIGMGSFSFKDSYVFNYVPKNKKETTQIAYQRGTQIGSKLMDYDLSVVDNKHANSFAVINFSNSDKTGKYSSITSFSDIDKEKRTKLFDDIQQLAKQGVTFPVHAIFYNQQNNSFRILDFSDVKIDGFSTVEEKKDYFEYYKNFLGL